MSRFTPRHVGSTFDRKRYEEIEEEANRRFEQDQARMHSNSDHRRKFLSFRSTRITAAFTRMISGSRTLLNRLASRQTNETTTSNTAENVEKPKVPVTETVTFPSDISPPNIPITPHSEPRTPISTAATSTNSILHFSDVPPVIGNKLSRVETDESSANDHSRFKESKSSKILFPQIEKRIVSVHKRSHKPLFTNDKSVESTSGPSIQGIERSNIGNIINEDPPPLAIPKQDESMFTMEQTISGSESDKESELDDSPRLYKHIMPKDEPKPWVEPGTVAQGADWLEPILTGRKRSAGISEYEENPSSPIRVAEAKFFN